MTTGLIIALMIIIAVFAAYRRMAKEIPILMYHRIDHIPGDRITLPPDKFDAQMAYLHKNGYTAITWASLRNHLTTGEQLPPKPVLLTFDDGYEDNFINALPILQRYGMKAIVFPVAGWIGQYNDWEDYPGKPHSRLMSWEQLAQWRQAGMEIGCHTVNHPHLSSLAEAEIETELTDSKRLLEDRLGMDIDLLCYPYGSLDSRVKMAAQKTGFAGAVAIFSDAPLCSGDRWALRRIPISQRQPLWEFALKVSPLHIILIALRKLERNVKNFCRSIRNSRHSKQRKLDI